MVSCLSRLWRSCRPTACRVFGPLWALILAVILAALGLLLLIVGAPFKLLQYAIAPVFLNSFGFIVEELYSKFAIFKLHVTVERCCLRRCARRAFHTRFVDIRVDVPLASGGCAAVHMMSCLILYEI